MKFSSLAFLSLFGAATAFLPGAPAFSRSAKTQIQVGIDVEAVAKETTTSVDDEDQGGRIINPVKNIQAYLERPEEGAAIRSNLKGVALVSGLVVQGEDRQDQSMFDLLHSEESEFGFEKIVAFVPDAKYAKKIMISRKARYTGLLDVLDFEQAEEGSTLPTTEQLGEVTTWVAHVDADHIETLAKISELANSVPSLQNVAVLLVGANELPQEELQKAIDFTTDSFSVMAVGSPTNTPEGSFAYGFAEFGTEGGALDAELEFSRGLAYKLLTDMLQLEAGKSKTLSFAEIYENDYYETKLIKGLRAGGFTRTEELEHMLNDGVQKYQDAVIKYKNSPYYKGSGTNYGNNWWLAPEFQKKSIDNTRREEALKEAEEAEERRVDEIEAIALEWAKREFYRASLTGTTELEEEPFIDSVWPEAVEEGKMKWAEMNPEVPDEDSKDTSFEAKMKVKEAAMLKKAKADLRRALDEDDDDDEPSKDEDDDDDDDDEDYV